MKEEYQTPVFFVYYRDTEPVLCQSVVLPGLEEDTSLEWED